MHRINKSKGGDVRHWIESVGFNNMEKHLFDCRLRCCYYLENQRYVVQNFFIEKCTFFLLNQAQRKEAVDFQVANHQGSQKRIKTNSDLMAQLIRLMTGMWLKSLWISQLDTQKSKKVFSHGKHAIVLDVKIYFEKI